MVRWDDAQSASEVFRGRAAAPAPPHDWAAPAAAEALPAHAAPHQPPGPWTAPFAEQRSPPPLRELEAPQRARGPPVWEPDEHAAGPWTAPELPNMLEEAARHAALGSSLPSRALPTLAAAPPRPAARLSAPAGAQRPTGERHGAEAPGDASELRRLLRQDVRDAVRDEVGRMLQEIQGGCVVERFSRAGSGASCKPVPGRCGSGGPRSRAVRPLSPASAADAWGGATESSSTRQLSMDIRRELVNHLDTEPHDGYDGDESNQVLRMFSKRVPPEMYGVKRCILFFDWLWALDEPPRRGLLASFLNPYFNNLAALVILVNAVYMIHSTNSEAASPGTEPSAAQNTIEVVFVSFYCVELLLKVLVHRGFYFWNHDVRWNMLDLFLVAYGLLEISLAGEGAQLSWLRALRLFKMAKVLRVLKVIKSLKELRLILACLTGSIISLFWSIVMMMFILFMFSLLFVQETAAYFVDSGDQLDETMGGLLTDNFGSVQVSMLSLWASLTGGNDWWFYYEALESTGPLAPALFLFFIAFSQIALLNILTGIFVESAMKLAEPDAQARAIELQQERLRQESDLRAICHELDADKTGTISLREFQNSLRSTKLTNYLDYLGIDMDQTKHLFYLLSEATSDQTVEIEKFVQGIVRMKGSANNIGMQRLTFEVLLSRRILQTALAGPPKPTPAPTPAPTPHHACARDTIT